jgi:hypothetical protein
MPDPLLGSPSRAFFLPRSRTLFPAPFPSWRFNAFRVLLHARVRHPVQLFKLKTERVALLGLLPSKVLSLPALVRPSSDLPSCGYSLGLTAKPAPLQGLSRRKIGWSLSRLPTFLGFPAFWSSCPFELRLNSGVASEGAWGMSPPPHQPFFESLRLSTGAEHHVPIGHTSTATVSSYSEVRARCLAVPDPSPNRAIPLVRLPHPAECSIRRC